MRSAALILPRRCSKTPSETVTCDPPRGLRGHGRGVRVPALSVDERPAWIDGSIGHAARAPPRHRSPRHAAYREGLLRPRAPRGTGPAIGRPHAPHVHRPHPRRIPDRETVAQPPPDPPPPPPPPPPRKTT